MSPFDAPVALVVLLAPSVVFVAVAAVAANVRHPKTPTPARPAAQMSRAGAGATCTVQNCRNAATNTLRVGYENWPFCTRCREEYDALTGRAS